MGTRLLVAAALVSACTVSCKSNPKRREAAQRRLDNRAEPVCLAFLSAVRQGDYATAHAKLHRRLRERIAPDELKARVNADPFLPGHTEAAVYEPGSTAVRGMLDVKGGDSVEFRCHHLAEGDEDTARIVTIVVAGVPAISLSAELQRRQPDGGS